MLEVLRSGRLSLGPMQERFERAFADRLGVADAVAVSSGTAALHLGVRALGWGEGDEVVTSPFSFVASANCLLYEGATPVFCDVDPVTLNLDPEAAARRRSASGPRACCRSTSSAIRPTLPALERLAAERGLGLLEDACEALGARRRRGPRGRLARQPGDLRLLRQQAADHGRGRDGGGRRPRGRRRGCAASATRAGRRTWTGSTTTGSASTTGSPSSRRRSASPSSSASTRCSPSAREPRRMYTERLAALDYGAPARPRANGSAKHSGVATSAGSDAARVSGELTAQVTA